MLTIDIPGIGSVTSVPFSLDAGIPLYITSSLGDTDFGFTLRDRYGNISPMNMSATLTRDSDTPKNIILSNGVYSTPRTSGYYIIRAPDLEKNTITYTDTAGNHTLSGITYATLYVPPKENAFSFR